MRITDIIGGGDEKCDYCTGGINFHAWDKPEACDDCGGTGRYINDEGREFYEFLRESFELWKACKTAEVATPDPPPPKPPSDRATVAAIVSNHIAVENHKALLRQHGINIVE